MVGRDCGSEQSSTHFGGLVGVGWSPVGEDVGDTDKQEDAGDTEDRERRRNSVAWR